MSTNDIKHLAVETIYLVPDCSEGQRCYLWCDDPAPGLDMDPSESVEYLRKDVHDAIIAKQAKAAKQGMDAAQAVARSNLEQAKRLHAECSPKALESEREDNSRLTELVAKLEQERDALAAERSDLIKELVPCQNVLHQLAQAGQCTPAYADDAKQVLSRVTGSAPPTFDDRSLNVASLARRDAAQRGKALFKTAKWFAELYASTEQLSAEVVYDILMDEYRRQTEGHQ